MTEEDYGRLRVLAEQRVAGAQADLERAQAASANDEESDLAVLADRLLARAESIEQEGDAAGALRRVVRATLSEMTATELDALDLEGRRARVRQVVERVEVGPFWGARALTAGRAAGAYCQRNYSCLPGRPSTGGWRCCGQVWCGKSTSSLAQ